MIVCIAEKPSVARDIAAVIGATASHDGYMEGNGYQVTWTFGHLCELKEPHEYTPLWKRWDVWDLPMIPQRYGIKLKEDNGVKKQFGIIERLMRQADGIVNCGDAGQEGELIQRWVMQKAGVTCPVKRLWISSLTEEAIREGFKSLKDQSEYQSLYEAGLSRAIGDWTLGMNATRLYTLKYGQYKQVLSIGRVQTPTLALIVRRQLEIDNFQPEQYWILSTVYRETTFAATKGKFTSQQEGEEFLEKVKYSPFTVTDVSAKKGTEAPPRLYDLTSLQVDCNRKFGYSADLTLQLIQSLYEKKFTTYPRVDTTFLSDDIYPKCPNILMGIRGYEQFTAPLYGQKLPKSKKVFDSSKVTDHHAIIPTGVPAQNLTDMERNVYDLVARTFIAVFYPDCKFLATTVLGSVEDVEFKATGKQIMEQGWRVLFAKDRQTDEEAKGTEEEKTLPAFVKGESGSHLPSLMEKWTTPPKPYTEATLLRAMETAGKFVDNEELRDALKENGIGRPSTRAAIIETLFKRRYIKKERKSVVPTPTGMELIGLIREELLKSAELTGIWEKKLREIEKKKYDARQFLDELKLMVADIVNAVRSDTSNRRVAITTEEDLKAGKKKRPPKEGGEGGKKTRTPRKPKAPAGEGGAALETVHAESLKTVDSLRTVAGFQPKGGRQAKAVAMPESGGGDEWVGLPCPVCTKGHIIKGRTAYGCSRWREGCTFRRPFEEKASDNNK
ncbi:MAG: DNA topoisomerase 3 [Bacteroides sp.]|nr:DNA topoisomerase 3 [Roseburia sp.]MCM1347340.1 DNA topoisomerase 3 [Bacteroides sp.]MCM1421834.1 DNA topoisomerase 3 [Bacteroides sp.]